MKVLACDRPPELTIPEEHEEHTHPRTHTLTHTPQTSDSGVSVKWLLKLPRMLVPSESDQALHIHEKCLAAPKDLVGKEFIKNKALIIGSSEENPAEKGIGSGNGTSLFPAH